MKFRLSIGFVLALLAVTSCVKDVILEAQEEPQLVVECVLTDEDVQILYLSYSKGASQALPQDVQEATVILTDLTENARAGHFTKKGKGIWQLDYKALPGHEYRLDVTVPNHEPIWAEQTMPEPTGLYTPRHWTYGASAMTLDPVGSEYEYEQGTFYRLEFLPDYTWVYALDYDEASGELKIAEEICTNFPYVDDFNVTGSYKPEVIPVNEWVYGNPCEGWALYPHLIGYGVHRRYLRLQNKRWNPESDRREFLISGSFTGRYYAATGASDPKPTEGRLVFASVSKDYDTYLQEALYCYDLQQSTDLSSVYYRQNVFSNITGGLGIFGAIIQTPLGWTRKYSPVNPTVIWDNPMTAPKSFYPDDIPSYLFF